MIMISSLRCGFKKARDFIARVEVTATQLSEARQVASVSQEAHLFIGV